MANDRWYNPGDNYLLDDIAGFKIRASRALIIPGGITGNLAVAPERWEPEQPQDFVTGVYDDQVADLVRSRQRNQFVIVGTFVTAPSARGAFTITVDDTTGFQSTSLIQIMLDSGENFRTQIVSVTGRVFQIAHPLPASVGSLYGDPIENSILLLELSSSAGFFVLDSANGVLDVNVLA